MSLVTRTIPYTRSEHQKIVGLMLDLNAEPVSTEGGEREAPREAEVKEEDPIDLAWHASPSPESRTEAQLQHLKDKQRELKEKNQWLEEELKRERRERKRLECKEERRKRKSERKRKKEAQKCREMKDSEEEADLEEEDQVEVVGYDSDGSGSDGDDNQVVQTRELRSVSITYSPEKLHRQKWIPEAGESPDGQSDPELDGEFEYLSGPISNSEPSSVMSAHNSPQKVVTRLFRLSVDKTEEADEVKDISIEEKIVNDESFSDNCDTEVYEDLPSGKYFHSKFPASQICSRNIMEMAHIYSAS